MKKLGIGAVITLFVLCLMWILVPVDTLNKLERKKIELTEGNFNVTYSQDNVVKVYKVRSGKVTSTNKGYYFFFVKDSHGNKKYRQVPIDKTIVEEI